jgi:PAS domain-containing protein
MKSDEDKEKGDLVNDIKSGRLPISGPELIQLLQRVLRKLSPILQVLLALISLTVAIVYGIKLRDRLINSQESMANTLQARLEPTLHPHQEVSAFVLSGLEVTPSDNKDYSEALTSLFNRIVTRINETIEDPKFSDVNKVFEFFKPEVTGSAPSWYQMVTSTKDQNGFLLIPGNSFRNRVPENAQLTQENLKDFLKSNRDVISDLTVISNIAPLLKELDGMPVQSLPIVQQYLISESGVVFIREAMVEDNIGYYTGQFSPATLFMDRPYFREAVRNPLKYGPFNYRSEPYIDSGGNGVVLTYSRKVDLANHRMGIICVDVKVPGAVDVITKRLTELGADVGEFYWVTDKGIEGKLPGDFGWVEAQLYGQDKKQQSKFLGAIAVESDYASTQKTKDSSGLIKLTIPIESVALDKGARKTKLLWARINFNRNRQALTHDLIWLSAGIILLVVVSSNIFHDYTVLRREMSSVLKKMSKVMYEASTPFAWLNEKNEFLKVNKSFLKLLGYSNEEDLKSHSPTFRGLITAATQPTYDAILLQSAAGSETGKYEIDMVTKKGGILHVVVHGERIPYPTFWRRRLPHRFGVFLEWSKKGETKPTVTTTILGNDCDEGVKHSRAIRKAERAKPINETINQNGHS